MGEDRAKNEESANVVARRPMYVFVDLADHGGKLSTSQQKRKIKKPEAQSGKKKGIGKQQNTEKGAAAKRWTEKSIPTNMNGQRTA